MLRHRALTAAGRAYSQEQRDQQECHDHSGRQHPAHTFLSSAASRRMGTATKTISEKNTKGGKPRMNGSARLNNVATGHNVNSQIARPAAKKIRFSNGPWYNSFLELTALAKSLGD